MKRSKHVRALPLAVGLVLLIAGHLAAAEPEAESGDEFAGVIEATYRRMYDAPPAEAAEFFHFEREHDRSLIVPALAAVLKEWNAIRPAKPPAGTLPTLLEALAYVGFPPEQPERFDAVDVSDEGERATCKSYEEGWSCAFRKVDGKWLWDGDAQFAIEDGADAKRLADYLGVVGDAVKEVRRARAQSAEAAAEDPARAVDRKVCTALMAKHMTDDSGGRRGPVLPKAAGEERLADGLGRVAGLAITRDGKLAVTGAGSAAMPLRLWNLDVKKFGRALWPAGDVLFDVIQVAFTQDGTRLVALGMSYPTSSVIRAARFGSLGEQGYDAFDARHVVWVFDVKTGRELHRFGADGPLDQSLAISPDGARVAVCGPFLTAAWNLETGKRAFESKTGGAAVSIGADDTLYVQRLNDSLAVIDLKTGKEGRSFPLNDQRGRRPMTTLAIGPAGRAITVATGSGITAYDIATGKEVRHYALPKQSGINRVNSIAVSGDGMQLLGACGLFSLDKEPQDAFMAAIVPADSRRVACLWDARSGQLLETYAGHAKAVSGAVFLAGERQILTSSTDGTLRIWPVP